MPLLPGIWTGSPVGQKLVVIIVCILFPYILRSSSPLLDSCPLRKQSVHHGFLGGFFRWKLPDYSSSFLLFLLASSACRMSSTLLSLSVGNRDFRVLFLDVVLLGCFPISCSLTSSLDITIQAPLWAFGVFWLGSSTLLRLFLVG
nr:hypothetical protein [Gigaspora margarita]